MYISRTIEQPVVQDLERKMVFISGPRQCGKTTLSRHISGSLPSTLDRNYLTWDALADRESMRKENFPAGAGCLVLDEIHKFPRWRQMVKGLFDTRGNEIKIIVSGSGRLDYYRRGGDSLQGRYHFYRLFPLTLGELGDPSRKTLQDLLAYGPFPESFLMASQQKSMRWSREYRMRIINDDLRDLERVADISAVEQLAFRLPDLTGAPLSINALREDLGVAHRTVSRWLAIFERLYMIFRIYPFGAPKIRAVKKEAKHYHFDWTAVEDKGKRFETCMASHLFAWCAFQQDSSGREVELRYFRDIDKREVDFVVVEKGRPLCFIEAKNADTEAHPGLRYLKQRFPEIPAIQTVLETNNDVLTKDGIRIMPACRFLGNCDEFLAGK